MEQTNTTDNRSVFCLPSDIRWPCGVSHNRVEANLMLDVVIVVCVKKWIHKQLGRFFKIGTALSVPDVMA